MEIELFIDEFLKELQSENAAVFLGAGASVPAGFINWKELLTPVAREVGLNIALESDLVTLAQFHVNANGMNRHVLSQTILEQLSTGAELTKNHKLLAKLPVSTYWTTNYDDLIERSLKEEKKVPDVKHSVKQLANTKPKRDAIVYKMHGDSEHSQDAIITKDDYEKYFHTHAAFISALSGDLVSKTFVFIGFSFSDPNLDYILSRVRVSFAEHQRRHFAFFRRRVKQDEESDDEYENAVVRQNLMVEDLKRFNVRSILVEEYSQITDALEEILRRYRRNTLFISSSASDFSPWGKGEVVEFMHHLGSLLVNDSLKVATGLGLGVGNALFTGAIEKIYRTPGKKLDDYLLLRPFPQFLEDQKSREKIWREYRESFIPSAGMSMFLFGNKIVDDEVVEADGMVQEFEIAKESGLLLLPIGATGSTAKMLSERILDNPEEFPGMTEEVLEQLKILHEPVESLQELFQPLKNLLTVATK